MVTSDRNQLPCFRTARPGIQTPGLQSQAQILFRIPGDPLYQWSYRNGLQQLPLRAYYHYFCTHRSVSPLCSGQEIRFLFFHDRRPHRLFQDLPVTAFSHRCTRRFRFRGSHFDGCLRTHPFKSFREKIPESRIRDTIR